MMRYMLESDLPQYLNEDYVVVRDHEGKLWGVLPVNHDFFDLIECVDEIPPEREPEPDNGLGYGPSGKNWHGISYQHPGFLVGRLTWDIKPGYVPPLDPQVEQANLRKAVEEATQPQSDYDSFLRSTILEKDDPL